MDVCIYLIGIDEKLIRILIVTDTEKAQTFFHKLIIADRQNISQV